MFLFGFLTIPAVLAASVSAHNERIEAIKSDILGVNVGGWLLIEEWFFSNGLFDKVAELRDEPQGVVMPPVLPNGFGEKYYSEGDLVNKLYLKFGEEKTIDIMEQHRSTYVTAFDFDEMARVGITKVRLPVGWWAFCNESIGNPTLINDPAYPSDRKYVSISQTFLRSTIQSIHDSGLKTLIDIHAFPGGSADGSYNGVFPNEPRFFKEESLQLQGFDILNNMFDFYDSLETELQESILGMTLMNEPAHVVPEDGNAMLTWMAQAVSLFRSRIVDPTTTTTTKSTTSHPLLFVNLISTCISNEQISDFMVQNFSPAELSSWAILDIHVYYAWDGDRSGCMDMADDCAWDCSADTSEAAFGAVKDTIYSAAATSLGAFTNNASIPLLACSEFSLASYHDSNNACRGYDMLDMMYDAQAQGFILQGVQDRSMFWTWKVPYGGSHEDGWSLQNFLRKKQLAREHAGGPRP